jgi:hypothetical protein
MSTKTTFKRIALVAVAALGLGVLTSVAPASAAAPTTATFGTPAASRVGVEGNVPVKFGFAAGSDGETFTVGARVVTAPTGSKAAGAVTTSNATATILYVNEVGTSGAASGTTNGVEAGAATEFANSSGTFDAATSSVITLGSSATATSATVNFAFKPDVAGTYTFLFWVGGTSWSASYVQTTGSVTVSGAPASITITKISGTIPNSDTTYGALLAISLKDAAGVATRLGASESLSITENGAVSMLLNDSAAELSGSSAGGSVAALAAGNDYLGAGTYYVRIVADGTTPDAATVTVTVSGSGGLIPATVTTNTTVSIVEVSASQITGIDLEDATGYYSASSDNDYTTSAGASHVFTATRSASNATADTVGKVHALIITNTSGLTYASTVTYEAGEATADFTVSSSIASTNLSTLYVGTEYIGGTDALIATVAYAKVALDALTVQGGTTSVLSALAGSTTWTVKATDTNGNAIQYVPVTVSVAGRNTVATTALGVTNADGVISYTLKDAGTTGTSDALSFSATFDSVTETATGTVTYGTVTVSTVTVSGGSKAETVAGSTLTAISAADNGPETSAKAVSAVIKDAAGNLLAGVPVTFAVDKGLVKKTSAVDYATVYTNSAGKATTYVFDWIPGKQTVTATAGGVSSTDYFTWAATDATSARTVAVSATGDIVTVKVTDRFGNGVKGATVNLSRTGTGLFGNGASTQDVVTDKDGTSDVRFAGTGTVVAELAATYVQAYDVAGEIAEEAVTAAVAGTTKGTGASLAPAGVAKASIAIEAGANSTEAAASAAADAAAEATDAANAATDAANAAAEAADAATAAAQDAADAVAALSTQVATYISNLRKQITALTNLVIKIQKKVNA